MPKFQRRTESKAKSMIWRAVGVYEISGRLRIQWREHGRTRYEFLRPGATLAQAIGRRQRHIEDAAEGKRTPTGTRLTYEGLMEGRETSLATHHKGARCYPALDAYFSGWKALNIDYTVLQDYVAERQANGAADATIHNELAALRRAFRLARKAGKLSFVPDFPMPTVQNVRESYFTVAELDRLLKLLPAYLRAPVQFASLTGMRAGNVFGLTWDHVDFGRGLVRVPVGMTKSGEPLAFPFKHGDELADLLREQQQRKRGSWVFHHAGRKIKSYHSAWKTAVKGLGDAAYGEQYDPASGTTKKVLKRFHDLRHSFAQAMTDAGVAEAEILALGGWQTPAMLRRYRIIDQKRKEAAVAQRDRHVEAERNKPQVIDMMKTLKVAGGKR